MLPKVRVDESGRKALREASSYFRSELARRGVEPLGDRYIVPIVIGEDARAVQIARRLQERGYDIRAIRPPSVPPGTSRLRISIHADHSVEMLRDLAEAIATECDNPRATET